MEFLNKYLSKRNEKIEVEHLQSLKRIFLQK